MPYERERDEMEPATKGELNKLDGKVEILKESFQDLKIEQRVQKRDLESLQKSLDRITTNTSRTMWTVIVGFIMLVVGYFFNPPTLPGTAQTFINLIGGF